MKLGYLLIHSPRVRIQEIVNSTNFCLSFPREESFTTWLSLFGHLKRLNHTGTKCNWRTARSSGPSGDGTSTLPTWARSCPCTRWPWRSRCRRGSTGSGGRLPATWAASAPTASRPCPRCPTRSSGRTTRRRGRNCSSSLWTPSWPTRCTGNALKW